MNDFANFKSIFKDEFIDFIKYKRLSGYEYKKKSYENLITLDYFFQRENINKKEITLDIIEKWLNKNEYNCESTKSNDYSTITSFSKFLISKGYKDIFIMPQNPYHRKNTFVPYIYSKEEISKIFNILKNNKDKKNGILIYICISILYCCGIRKSELINLKLKDFNYGENILTIENGKNSVKRLIPLTETLSTILKEYINHNIYTSNSDFIFNPNGSRVNLYRIIRLNFKETLVEVGIKNNSPRLHDLRHTFAIHTLNNMLEKGFELYQCLSTLSVYLGHKSIYETEYYLRLAEINFNDFINKTFKYTNCIYKRKDKIYNGE